MNWKEFVRKQLWPNRDAILAFFRIAGVSRDSNRAPPEYKSRALQLHQKAYVNTVSATDSEERDPRNVRALYDSNEADHPRCLFPFLVVNKLNIFSYFISSQVLG
jgi:hypothetical protein